MALTIGFAYDLRDEYKKLGFSSEEVAEFDSLATIEAIEEALQANGHTVERIGHIWNLTKAIVAGKRWDLVFNITEGVQGLAREAQVPALLDAYNIPYTFSTPDVLALCQNKAITKLAVEAAGVPSAAFAVVSTTDGWKNVKLAFPLFAKPVAEGTSKGISARSLINNSAELESTCNYLLEHFKQPVLVETYLPGREFTVGIIGTGEDSHALGTVEVAYNKHSDACARTYDNKDKHETLDDYVYPDDVVSHQAIQTALAAWKALGCRDGGRIDLRCDINGIPNFIEANPLAGLKPGHSDLPILAERAGVTYHQLIKSIVESAHKRTTATQQQNLQHVHA